tara:strand:+ start:4901 stop:5167 length:267 start_codon:yes stop_codon:yes gene_type:complete
LYPAVFLRNSTGHRQDKSRITEIETKYKHATKEVEEGCFGIPSTACARFVSLILYFRKESATGSFAGVTERETEIGLSGGCEYVKWFV